MKGLRVRSVIILGVRVDDVTLSESVDLLNQFVRSGTPHLVATTNTEFVMAAQRDTEFRDILNRSALSIPDGVGLIWGARLLGRPIREHVRGTDLVDRLMEHAAKAGYRVFLLGAAEGVADAAAARLRERLPQLQIAGVYAGSPDPAFDVQLVDLIRAAAPVQILLVAYGAPRQEKWIARNLDRLGVPLAIGVGGTLDFLAGRVKRAPVWVRRLELEWLYRLIQEPWRWRRQLALPRFALKIAVAKLLQMARR